MFTGRIRGANERLAAAFIGMGRMGTSNLQYAMRQPGVQVVALCDVFQPNLDHAMAVAREKTTSHELCMTFAKSWLTKRWISSTFQRRITGMPI